MFPKIGVVTAGIAAQVEVYAVVSVTVRVADVAAARGAADIALYHVECRCAAAGFGYRRFRAS